MKSLLRIPKDLELIHWQDSNLQYVPAFDCRGFDQLAHSASLTSKEDLGQGSRTRTYDFFIPSEALYQTELYPVYFLIILFVIWQDAYSPFSNSSSKITCSIKHACSVLNSPYLTTFASLIYGKIVTTNSVHTVHPLIYLVRLEGLEPPRRKAPEPKSGVSTNFTTGALVYRLTLQV